MLILNSLPLLHYKETLSDFEKLILHVKRLFADD
jgi:hypothetical protein